MKIKCRKCSDCVYGKKVLDNSGTYICTKILDKVKNGWNVLFKDGSVICSYFINRDKEDKPDD